MMLTSLSYFDFIILVILVLIFIAHIMTQWGLTIAKKALLFYYIKVAILYSGSLMIRDGFQTLSDEDNGNYLTF